MEDLEKIAKLVRYYILRMTTRAGSGHPTSSLSATDIMVALFFGKLRFDPDYPDNLNNDRVIFSKGHASPLLYALWAVACLRQGSGGQAGAVSEKELLTYRQFGSELEGHPTPSFKYVDVATGSLGQGLSIGLGMALALRAQISNFHFSQENLLEASFLISNKQSISSNKSINQKINAKWKMLNGKLPMVYVLMGDSETSEGSVWEAMQLASYYKVGNLVGIIDVNRLGQSGETMLGWDVETYKKRVEAFGWQAHIVDGHDMGVVVELFDSLPHEGQTPFGSTQGKPQMIIAKTIKGKGVSFLENKEGWHGKALSPEQLEEAVKELGKVDKSVRGAIRRPISNNGKFSTSPAKGGARSNSNYSSSEVEKLPHYKLGEMVATRKAFGEALAQLGEVMPEIVSLDGEVKNSTYAEVFAKKFPNRYFEMFIAEQNMVGAALGMSKRGLVPFVSTFAAFFTRAFDQIRMSAISRPNIKFVGSHAGVSIGEDGPSQMGLEDLAMFRAVFGSVVLVPCDAVSCTKLVDIAAKTEGLIYIRTARPATPVIYKNDEDFKIGGSKVVKSSDDDKLTIVACGVALVEAVKAADKLAKDLVNVRVIDAYSIKPIDETTLKTAAKETNNLILTVEDHWFDGGLGDAVLNVFANPPRTQSRIAQRSGQAQSGIVSIGGVQVYKLAIFKMPMSGKGEELLKYEGISAEVIVNKVKELVG